MSYQIYCSTWTDCSASLCRWRFLEMRVEKSRFKQMVWVFHSRHLWYYLILYVFIYIIINIYYLYPMYNIYIYIIGTKSDTIGASDFSPWFAFPRLWYLKHYTDEFGRNGVPHVSAVILAKRGPLVNSIGQHGGRCLFWKHFVVFRLIRSFNMSIRCNINMFQSVSLCRTILCTEIPWNTKSLELLTQVTRLESEVTELALFEQARSWKFNDGNTEFHDVYYLLDYCCVIIQDNAYTSTVFHLCVWWFI